MLFFCMKIKRKPVCAISIVCIKLHSLFSQSVSVYFYTRFNVQCEQNASITLNDYMIERKTQAHTV